jgi:hypothetical protein
MLCPEEFAIWAGGCLWAHAHSWQQRMHLEMQLKCKLCRYTTLLVSWHTLLTLQLQLLLLLVVG